MGNWFCTAGADEFFSTQVGQCKALQLRLYCQPPEEATSKSWSLCHGKWKRHDKRIYKIHRKRKTKKKGHRKLRNTLWQDALRLSKAEPCSSIEPRDLLVFARMWENTLRRPTTVRRSTLADPSSQHRHLNTTLTRSTVQRHHMQR